MKQSWWSQKRWWIGILLLLVTAVGSIDRQAMSIETFADAWLFADQLGERNDANAPFGPHLYNYWQHLLDWWAARDKAPVLYLAYEHMRRDLATYVARIAEFMGIAADSALLALATRQSTFEFMAANKDQFAERLPGTPLRFDKVVTGEVGSHRTKVSAELGARIEGAWQQYITPVLGFASYEALIGGLA